MEEEEDEKRRRRGGEEEDEEEKMKMRRRRRGMGPIWSSGSCRMRRGRGLGCAGTAGRSIRDNPREGDLERLSEHGGGRRARKCSPGEGGGMEGRTGMREGSEPRSCSRTGSRCSRQPGDSPQEGWPFPARTRSITAPIINNRAPQNSPSWGCPQGPSRVLPAPSWSLLPGDSVPKATQGRHRP